MSRQFTKIEFVAGIAPLLSNVIGVAQGSRVDGKLTSCSPQYGECLRFCSTSVANCGTGKRPDPSHSVTRMTSPITVNVPAFSPNSHRNPTCSDRRRPVPVSNVTRSTRSCVSQNSDPWILARTSRSRSAVRALALGWFRPKGSLHKRDWRSGRRTARRVRRARVDSSLGPACPASGRARVTVATTCARL